MRERKTHKQRKYGGIAQLARATGSYPVGHGFKSNSRYHWPVGQAVKTPPFHGGNGSSILPRVTREKRDIRLHRMSLFFLRPRGENRSAMQVLLALLEFAFCEQGDGSSLTRAASKNIRQRRNSRIFLTESNTLTRNESSLRYGYSNDNLIDNILPL